MAIEIYAFEPAAAGAMFPAMEPSLKLYAVAPLEQREKVESFCAERNKEAAEAGVSRRFKWQITSTEIWT